MFFAPALRTQAYVSPRALDRSFERFVNEAFTPARSASRTAAQVQQNEQGWQLQLDVPGVPREQLNIAIEGAVVRIETVADAPRQYKLAYELPQEIDAGASQAKLEHGVLSLQLAKLQPVSKAVSLTIE